MHVLYRFYNAAGDLLYVGITNNPPRRLSEHRDSKDWWLDVARVEIEHYPSREQLAQAERAAIQAESPLHNIAHASEATPANARRHSYSPYLRGEVYAFRLRDGTCPVGVVTDHDDEGWLAIDLYSWMLGRFTAGEKWINETQVFSVLRAVKNVGRNGTEFEMDSLGDYQTEWLNIRERSNPARWEIWLDELEAMRS